MSEQAVQRALEVKRRHENELMRQPNVVAVGIGFKLAGDTLTNELSIVVSVVKKLPLAQLTEAAVVPKAFDGMKTDVIETGLIVALPDPKQKWSGCCLPVPIRRRL